MFYVTFGQIHTHSVNELTFDKDCVAQIEAKDYESAREKAFEVFGKSWCFLYDSKPDNLLMYYPRGILPVAPE